MKYSQIYCGFLPKDSLPQLCCFLKLLTDADQEFHETKRCSKVHGVFVITHSSFLTPPLSILLYLNCLPSCLYFCLLLFHLSHRFFLQSFKVHFIITSLYFLRRWPEKKKYIKSTFSLYYIQN